MSTSEPYVPIRQPLGLPAGSIRALLSLGIAGAFWLYLTLPKATHVPLYLHFLAFVLLVFFASHGRSIGGANQAHPWYLPRGTFRFLILAGTIGVLVWEYLQDPQEIVKRLRPLPEELDHWAALFGAMLGGFFLGWALSHGPWSRSAAFQDFLAWIAVIALLMFFGEVLWKGFIDPNAKLVAERMIWETALVGVISCYFGSRE